MKKIIQKLLDVPETPTSEIDQFLQKFDVDHPKLSESQRKEIAKAERIAKLRDG